MLSTIFWISLIAVVLMVAIKQYELKKQKVGILSKVFSRLDRPLERYYEKSLDVCDKTLNGVVIGGTERAPKYFKETCSRAIKLFSEKYNSALPNIRGTIKFRSEKSASSFLKDIHQHKELIGKGRIES